MNPFESIFPLGRTVITANARIELHPKDVFAALMRHASGDWGDVSEHDGKENEFSLTRALRLFSVYHDRAGNKFWIITEADRSVTNVELHICCEMLTLQKCEVVAQMLVFRPVCSSPTQHY